MPKISLVKETHNRIRKKLHPGAIAIDATVGNGFDTLFLAEQVGKKGRVYGFDIQKTALDITYERLQQANLLACLTLIQASHATMVEKIPIHDQGNIKAIMFNLGYLPHGDKTIVTSSDSTLIALNSAAELLAEDGIITVLAYTGHIGGQVEADCVKNWCGQLDCKKYKVDTVTTENSKLPAPMLFVISGSDTERNE